ncbi:hypothetical protein RIF29_33136 [Crotalaria pallida]|uniref:Uncharacterized protein n=1 Tax=Crotalaria pallida TaxID=3830 RepID=A0AAN9EAC9_CROPI
MERSGDILNQNRERNDGLDDDHSQTKSSTLVFKGQIDLNIQPEREEELSPSSDSVSMMKALHNGTERYIKQQSILNFVVTDSSFNQSHRVRDGTKEEKLGNGIALRNNSRDADQEHAQTLSMYA